jgi:DHA2 family multidrug resistance protein
MIPISCVLVMRACYNADAPMAVLLLATFIQGAAIACFFVPLVTLSLSGPSPERIPAASGLFNFARITAGSFATSVVTTLWDRRATLHHARLIEHLTRSNTVAQQAVANLQAGPLAGGQDGEILNRLVDG